MHPPAWKFPTFKSVKSAMYRSRAKRFPPLPATRQQLEIPAHWRVTKSGRPFFMYNNVHYSVLIFCTEENLRELAGQSVWGCPSAANYYLRLRDCPYAAVQVADLGLRARYLREAETKKIIKMLMATAFLPLNKVPEDVDLLGRDVTGSVAALFEYFREEWMTPNRMPLWNVINRQAGKRHLTFYELLRLLIDEQGSTETLLEQVTSGRVTASHLRAKNSKYEDVQLCISALTAEYDGGTRTMEQFLRAVAYDVPEPLNFLKATFLHFYFVFSYSLCSILFVL
ncbi:hypothetical protein T05_4959 [Trichinella murrelli]|uniref:Uncharacterized protein n=1 Tax=Trichinella murrelli TaxID=144512 RepID=A0A0V0T3A8_9BILA|nr:hypothetical protein T05_4959 [Trichinella murrelli]